MAKTIFPWIFIVSAAFALVYGLQPGFFPRAKQSSRSFWGLVSLGLFLTVIGVAMWALSEGPVETTWSTDFFSFGQDGLARLGLQLNFSGLLVSWLAAIIYGYIFFLEPLFRADSKHGAVQHSAVLGLSSVALGWFSSSLWTHLLAQVLAALSGWIVLSRLGRQQENFGYREVAITYIRERSLGIGLVVLGAGVCAISGARIDWTPVASSEFPETGAVLILLGAFVQLQLFPAQLWSTKTVGQSTLPAPVQLLIGSPSTWAGTALIMRLVESHALHGSWYVGFATPLVFLTALSSLGNGHLQSAFGVATAAVSGMSAIVFLAAGTQAGGALFVTSQLGIWGLSLFLRSPLEINKPSMAQRIAVSALLISMFGGPGFASAGAFLRAVDSSENVLLQVMIGATWILIALAMMRVMALQVSEVPEATVEFLGVANQASPLSRLAPLAVSVVLSLAILWNGDAMGPLSANEAGSIGPNWSFQLFGSNGSLPAGSLQTGLWIWMMVLVLTVAAGTPQALAKASFRYLSIPAEGYHLPQFVSLLLVGGVVAVDRVSSISGRFLAPVFIHAPARILSRVSQVFSRWDRWTIALLDQFVRYLIDVPAKGLQLMHSGSIQLYILFTVGFTLAMLLHFISQLRP